MANSDRTPSTAPTPQRPAAGLTWWVVGAVALSVVGVLLLALLGQPLGPQIGATPAAPQSAATSTPELTPGQSTPEVLPTLAPADSPLHHMATEGEGACPDFGLQRGSVPAGELEAYLTSLLDCLMLVNEQPFTDAGLNLSRPVLAPASGMDNSGCVREQDGQDDWAGLYCPANNAIYFRPEWQPDDPLHYVDVMAHEFAHHLQHQAGILDPVRAEQAQARERANGELRVQDLSRRLELHAECVTGAMMGPDGPLAVRAGEFAEFVEARATVPPQWAATHGTGLAQTRWFKTGAYADGPAKYAACNTFAALPEHVR